MSDAKTRIALFGSRPPAEVNSMIKSLKRVEEKVFTDIVQVAACMLKLKNDEAFEELAKEIDATAIETVYPGVLLILQKALRIPPNQMKRSQFNHALTELNIAEKFQKPLSDALFNGEDCLTQTFSNPTQQMFPKVNDVRWRVDVTISTTSLNRVLEPSLLMNVSTDDNKEHLFEVSKEKFHELRYSVAEVLNHMQQLEKRSVLKLDT